MIFALLLLFLSKDVKLFIRKANKETVHYIAWLFYNLCKSKE